MGTATTSTTGSTAAPRAGGRGARRRDLDRVEQALTGIARIGNGKAAASARSRRAGVRISRPGVAVLAGLVRSGRELRVKEIVDLTGLEFGAADRGRKRGRAERMRGHRRERAVEAANRRAGSGGDDDIFHDVTSS